MSRFILASQSPRRRQLLQDAGYSVTCHNPAVEELCDAEKPRELVSLNASLKAMEVAVKFPDAVVLAADTLVVFAGEIFGKPADMADAFRMLRKLSGAIHEVLTGVCIVKFDSMRICRFEDRSYVKFRTLTDAMIEEYFRDINPLDKAGAYAAQEDNGRIIECIEGSLTNVIGLPMERLQLAMAEHFPEIVSGKI
ncbi:MAG: nucleoside triphosphate pyrophosphatase [Chthoniobacterales bacterium]